MTVDADPDDIEWLPSMEAEVSGFGDEHWDYEKACRDMVIAGAKWLAEHPDAEPEIGEMTAGDGDVTVSFYGVVSARNEDGEELLEAITEPVEGPTGAMVHGAVQHVFYIMENGWERYVDMMQEPEEVSDD